MLTRTVLSLAALSLLSVPAVADGNRLDEIIDTSWKLTALNGTPTAAGVVSSLTISADRVGGNGGCNTFGGDLTATPDGIDISHVFSTMMACDDLQQEQAFFAALEATNDFAVVDGNLQLLENGNVVAELAPAS